MASWDQPSIKYDIGLYSYINKLEFDFYMPIDATLRESDIFKVGADIVTILNNTISFLGNDTTIVEGWNHVTIDNINASGQLIIKSDLGSSDYLMKNLQVYELREIVPAVEEL